MLTTEKLVQYGADTESALKRCLDNEELYLKLVASVADDTRIARLEKEINAGDLDAAFETAHALKGMYGNIGITPIYEPACKITELLRNRTKTDYSPLLQELIEQKKKLDLLSE